jgi:hypothetical protein
MISKSKRKATIKKDIAKAVSSRLGAMDKAEQLTRAKGKLKPIRPVAHIKGKHTISDMLIEDRD